MPRSFLHMENQEVAAALRVLFERGEVELIEEVFIAEADVFLCRWRGKRVNVKFDFAYGPELSFLEPTPKQEREELETLIASVEVPAD